MVFTPISYWGQNSVGAAGAPASEWQQPIDYYCQVDRFTPMRIYSKELSHRMILLMPSR